MVRNHDTDAVHSDFPINVNPSMPHERVCLIAGTLALTGIALAGGWLFLIVLLPGCAQALGPRLVLMPGQALCALGVVLALFAIGLAIVRFTRPTTLSARWVLAFACAIVSLLLAAPVLLLLRHVAGG